MPSPLVTPNDVERCERFQLTHLSTLAGAFRLPNSGHWFMLRERWSNGSIWDKAVIPVASPSVGF